MFRFYFYIELIIVNSCFEKILVGVKASFKKCMLKKDRYVVIFKYIKQDSAELISGDAKTCLLFVQAIRNINNLAI